VQLREAQSVGGNTTQRLKSPRHAHHGTVQEVNQVSVPTVRGRELGGQLANRLVHRGEGGHLRLPLCDKDAHAEGGQLPLDGRLPRRRVVLIVELLYRLGKGDDGALHMDVIEPLRHTSKHVVHALQTLSMGEPVLAADSLVIRDVLVYSFITGTRKLAGVAAVPFLHKVGEAVDRRRLPGRAGMGRRRGIPASRPAGVATNSTTLQELPSKVVGLPAVLLACVQPVGEEVDEVP